MSTLEVVLSDPLREFVEAQVSAGRAPSASNFVRQLVRAAQQKQTQQALVEALLHGMQSGPAVLMSDADWKQMPYSLRR